MPRKKSGFMTRTEFRRKPKSYHVEIYRQYCSAYAINLQGGYTKQAAFSRQQMEFVLSFGKISEVEAAFHLGTVWGSVETTKQWMDRFLINLERGMVVPAP